MNLSVIVRCFRIVGGKRVYFSVLGHVRLATLFALGLAIAVGCGKPATKPVMQDSGWHKAHVSPLFDAGAGGR